MAARQFGVSLLPFRWSQITDSTTKIRIFKRSLRYKKCLFLFLFFVWPICYRSNFPVFNQIQCKCELLDHSNDWLFLKSATFCMNYAIFWAKLEVMVITLEPRTSNIAGSSCKYTDGFFICFYIRSIDLSLLDMSQVGVIVFWIFIEGPYIFSYHSLAINDAMHTRTVYDKCRLQCVACKCYTPARASVI